jgi:hypothetical protein
MKQTLTITVCLLISFQLLLAQSVKTGKGTVNGATFKYHYLEPSGNKKGIVILLPGSGEKFQNVLTKTPLPKMLTNQGFVVIVPEVHTLLFADDYSIGVLNELLKMKVPFYGTKKVILGGFSSGGAIATRYAELLIAENTQVDLRGLLVVDPPLDLQRVYAAGERMEQNCNGIIKRDGASIKVQLINAFGGSPHKQSQQYINHSSFTAGTSDGGNASFLTRLPIRLYSEPDLTFVQKTYCDKLQFKDINATDLEALHQFLIKAGSNNCEYITTKGRGFHSWNIIEPANCIEWITSITK